MALLCSESILYARRPAPTPDRARATSPATTRAVDAPDWLLQPLLDGDVPEVRRRARGLADMYGETVYQQAGLAGPVFAAIYKDNYKLLEALAPCRAVFRMRDGMGRQPIHVAAMEGNAKLIELFVRAGTVDLSSKVDGTGETPLFLAVAGAKPQAVDKLLELKADPNGRNSAQQAPLHLAAEKGLVSVAEALLRSAATDVNARDNRERTPLHWAAEVDRTEVVRLLLGRRADATLKDFRGETALDIAKRKYNDGAAQLLGASGSSLGRYKAIRYSLSLKRPPAR